MNERLLARGKLKYDNLPHKKGDWVYGNYVELKDGDRTIHCIYGYGEIIPETLGGYTCLTDKNGNRIFEGDIIKTKKYVKIVGHSNVNDYDIFVVKYEPAVFRLDNHNRGFNLVGEGMDYEVIGNIHDNPELLKEVVQNGG